MSTNTVASPRLLHMENVYQGYGEKIVLDNIDLSVATGEFVAVVGPSGCGKSTLLRLVIGQEHALSGTILLDNQPIRHPTRAVGIVYQNYSLFPNLSALDNVLAGHRLRTWPRPIGKVPRKTREKAEHYLERAGMADHIRKYPHQLSGGQQQRVAITQALMQGPKVLCMDEPFSALDPGTREDMQVFLLELWEALGMTVFFVTHDLEEATYLSTRLLALSQYYSDDRGNGSEVKRGAKIVIDKQLRAVGQALSPDVKKSAAMGTLIQWVRATAYNPDDRLHAREFALTHPDSWHTLTPEEDTTMPHTA